MELVDLLLLDFNTYRRKTQHTHAMMQENPWAGKALKKRPEVAAVLQEMVTWCRANSVEPRLWLFFLFKMRNWRFAPKLRPADLLSQKALARYKPQDRLEFFREHTQQFALVQEVGFDPNRDLTGTVEAAKRAYQAAGKHLQCKEEMLVGTLGFHPQSAVCAACPVAADCAVELEASVAFSMLAVRNGKLTAAQAERIARRGGQW